MSARQWLRDRPGLSAEATGGVDVAVQSGGLAWGRATPQKGRRTPKRRHGASSTEEGACSQSPRRTSGPQTRRSASSPDAEPAVPEEAGRAIPAVEGGGAAEEGDVDPFSDKAREGGRASHNDLVSSWQGVEWKPHGAQGQVSGVALALEARGWRQGVQEVPERVIDAGSRAAGGRASPAGDSVLRQGAAGAVARSHEGADAMVNAAAVTGQTAQQAPTSCASQTGTRASLSHTAPSPPPAAAPARGEAASSSVVAAGATDERTSSGGGVAGAADAAVAPGGSAGAQPWHFQPVDLTDDEDIAEISATLPPRPKKRYRTGHPALQGVLPRGGGSAGADLSGASGRQGSGSGARAAPEVVDLDQEDDDCEVVFATNVRRQNRRAGRSETHAVRGGGAAGVGTGTQIFIIVDSPEDLRQAAAASRAAGERVNGPQPEGAASHSRHRVSHFHSQHLSHGRPPIRAEALRPVPAEPSLFLGRERPASPAGPQARPVASHNSGSPESTQGQGAPGASSRLGWQFSGASSMVGGAASFFSAAAAAASAGLGATLGSRESGGAGQSSSSMFGQPRPPIPVGHGTHDSMHAPSNSDWGQSLFLSAPPGAQAPRPGGPGAAGSVQGSPAGVTGGLNIKCPICLDTISEETTTTCGHLFCKPCIALAVQTKKCCPTCRRKLGKSGYHRVYLS